jgi:hypothetical protein
VGRCCCRRRGSSGSASECHVRRDSLFFVEPAGRLRVLTDRPHFTFASCRPCHSSPVESPAFPPSILERVFRVACVELHHDPEDQPQPVCCVLAAEAPAVPCEAAVSEDRPSLETTSARAFAGILP